MESLLEEVIQAGQAYKDGQDGARETLLILTRLLIASLESPIESLLRMGWAEVSDFPPDLDVKNHRTC